MATDLDCGLLTGYDVTISCGDDIPPQTKVVDFGTVIRDRAPTWEEVTASMRSFPESAAQIAVWLIYFPCRAPIALTTTSEHHLHVLASKIERVALLTDGNPMPGIVCRPITMYGEPLRLSCDG